MASSSPPPSANPFTAATDGLPGVSRRRNTRCPSQRILAHFHGRKRRQFADIRSRHKSRVARAGHDRRANAGIPRDRRKASPNSTITARERALRFSGRLKVTNAMPKPSVSNRMWL